MRTRLQSTARVFAFWSIPLLAFFITRYVRAEQTELVMRYELEMTPGQIIGKATVIQGRSIQLSWEGSLAAATAFSPSVSVDYGDAGVSGNHRRVALDPGESVTWYLDLDRETDMTGTRYGSELSFVNLDRVLPSSDYQTARIELILTDPQQRGVWLPGMDPNGNGRAIYESDSIPGLGMAVIGDLHSIRVGATGSATTNSPSPEAADREFLEQVNQVCLELFEHSLGSAGLQLFMRIDRTNEFLGQPFSFSERGAVMLLDRPRTRSAWVHMGRQLFLRHFRAQQGEEFDRDPEQAWMIDGLARIIGEVVADRVEGAGLAADATTDSRRSWDLELISKFQAKGPYNFTARQGPLVQLLSHRRIWQDVMCPRVLLAAAEGSGIPMEQLVQPAFLRALSGELSGGSSSADARKLLEHARRLGREVPNLYFDTDTHPQPQIEHMDEHVNPSLVLLIEEDSMGFLETCGCRVNQSGGAARRASVIGETRAKYGNRLLCMDLGNRYPGLVSWSDREVRIGQGQLLDRIFDSHELDVLVPDPLDVMNLGWRNPSEWIAEQGVSCNLQLADGRAPVPYRIFERDGTRVAVVGVSGERWRMGHFNATFLIHGRNGFHLYPVLSSLESALAELHALPDPPDVTVLAGQVPEVFVREILARDLPIDLIVSSDAATLQAIPDDPRQVKDEPDSTFDGRRAIVYVNEDSYSLLSLGIQLDENRSIIGVDRVVHRLSDEVQDDSAVRARIEEFYRSASEEQAASLQPLFPGNGASGGGYVGSDVCRACHLEASNAWRQSKHGSAYHTLLAVQRNFVPKCVQCHVVGLGEEDSAGGARWGDISEGFLGVGCEVCHGGGREHIAAPSTTNIRRQMSANQCIVCHDLEHSGDFATRYLESLETIRHWPVEPRSR